MLSVRFVFIKQLVEHFVNIKIQNKQTIQDIFKDYNTEHLNDTVQYVYTLDTIYLLFKQVIYTFDTDDFINKLNISDNTNCQSWTAPINQINVKHYSSIFVLLTISYFKIFNYILNIDNNILTICSPLIIGSLILLYIPHTIYILWSYKYIFDNILLRSCLVLFIGLIGFIFSPIIFLGFLIILFTYPTNDNLISSFLKSTNNSEMNLTQFNLNYIRQLMKNTPYFKYWIIFWLNLFILLICTFFTNTNSLMVTTILVFMGLINYMKQNKKETTTSPPTL